MRLTIERNFRFDRFVVVIGLGEIEGIVGLMRNENEL